MAARVMAGSAFGWPGAVRANQPSSAAISVGTRAEGGAS